MSRPPTAFGAEGAARSISWAGHIIGTPAFMAPEQAKSSNVDHRADIYSLGATLFSLLAGKAMFEGHVQTVIRRKLKGEIPSLANACEGVPKEIDAVYQQMVAPNPDDRYQSMDEVIQALHTVQSRFKIFISYRREDSIDATDRIYEKLALHFGTANVFMDVDAIPPGTDYRQYLHDSVSASAAMLVVIGHHWTTVRGKGVLFWRRRLHDPTDWVRIEIEMAIKHGIPIIPVLVGQGVVPFASTLPESLRPILNFQTTEVRPGRHFTEHIQKLIRTIEGYL